MKLYCFLKNKNYSVPSSKKLKKKEVQDGFKIYIYNMEQKYAIIKENAKIYQKERKKVKSMILDELVKILNMNRQYLSFLLRNTGKRVVFQK